MDEFLNVVAVPDKENIKHLKMLKSLSRAFKDLNVEIENPLQKTTADSSKNMPISQINLTKISSKIDKSSLDIQANLENSRNYLKDKFEELFEKKITSSSDYITEDFKTKFEDFKTSLDSSFKDLKTSFNSNLKRLDNELLMIKTNQNKLYQNLTELKTILSKIVSLDKSESGQIKNLTNSVKNYNEKVSNSLSEEKDMISLLTLDKIQGSTDINFLNNMGKRLDKILEEALKEDFEEKRSLVERIKKLKKVINSKKMDLMLKND